MRQQYTLALVSLFGLGLFLMLAAGGYASGPRDNVVLTILGRWTRTNRFGKADPVTSYLLVGTLDQVVAEAKGLYRRGR